MSFFVYFIIFLGKVKLGGLFYIFLMLVLNNMSSFIFVFIIVFFCLGLGGMVYFENRKGKINQIFAALILFLVVWLVSNFLENTDVSREVASLFLEIDFASAAILAYFFFLFTANFQGYNLVSFKTKRQQILTFLPTFILSVLSFTDLIVRDISFKNQVISFETGTLFPLYALGLLSYIGIGCIDLVSKYRKLKGIERVQTLYVLLGFSISAILALVINLFFQQIVSVNVFRIGNYGVFFFVGFTTFAILKHHLLDIKVIFTEILVVVIALLLFVQIFISQTAFEYIWKSILFFIFLIFGYLLIRSVIQEIERRIELQRLYQEVEKLNKTKSEFISIASHQLRTPLTAIKGYISMFMEGSYGKLSEKQTKPLENVYQSNERLIRLVNDLLSVSRIESGKIKIETEEASIEDLVSSVVEELKPTTGEKGINLIFEKSKIALPKISVDKFKLRQVIMNLIDNAIRYTNKGEIKASVKKSDFKIIISVADTGEGMTKEEIGNLFESFSRGKAGTRFWTEGAGLGLYIAKKFTDMHNGKIWAESKGVGKGSTFHIELPIK